MKSIEVQWWAMSVQWKQSFPHFKSFSFLQLCSRVSCMVPGNYFINLHHIWSPGFRRSILLLHHCCISESHWKPVNPFPLFSSHTAVWFIYDLLNSHSKAEAEVFILQEKQIFTWRPSCWNLPNSKYVKFAYVLNNNKWLTTVSMAHKANNEQ